MPRGPQRSTYSFIQHAIRAIGDFDEEAAVGVRRLIDRSRLHFYRPGECLTCQQDDEHLVHFVNHGIFKGMLGDCEGNRTLLSLSFRGGLIGEAAALDECVQPVTVTAAMDSSVLRLGSFDTIAGVLGRENTYRLLSRSLCGRMRELEGLHETVLTCPSHEAVVKIVRRIIAESRAHDDGCGVLTIPLSQQDLSLMTGYRRETVNRAIRHVFADRVRFGRHGFQVLSGFPEVPVMM